MNGNGAKRKTALAVTFCGLMAALGVGLMLLGAALAVAAYAAPMLASVCLIPVIYEFGRPRAWLCFIASAVLVILLSPDKELAFFYAAMGYYPMIRETFGRIRLKPLRVIVKLAFFAAVIALLYLFLCFILKLDAVLAELQKSGAWLNALFFILLTLAMLLYDRAVSFAERVYIEKLRPKLRFLDR